jgi:hypothetical protein
MTNEGFGWRSTRAGPQVRIARLVGAVLLAVLAGCAATGRLTKDTPPDVLQGAVQERALARWQAIIDGDVARAYTDYMSPGSKEAISLEAFKQRMAASPGIFRKIEPGTVECSGESCKVKVFVWYDHRLMKGIRTPMEEVWIIDKGQAWYVWRQ